MARSQIAVMAITFLRFPGGTIWDLGRPAHVADAPAHQRQRHAAKPAKVVHEHDVPDIGEQAAALAPQQLATMSEQDAQLLQILIRQIRQNRLIDRVVAECCLILFEAKAPQPTPRSMPP